MQVRGHVRMDLNTNFGEGVSKPPQQLWKPRMDDSFDGPNRDRSAIARAIGNGLHHARRDSEEFFRVLQKLFAGMRERDGPLVPFEQPHAKIALKRSDARGNSRLSRMQLFGCGSEAVKPRNPHECLDEAKVHLIGRPKP